LLFKVNISQLYHYFSFQTPKNPKKNICQKNQGKKIPTKPKISHFQYFDNWLKYRFIEVNATSERINFLDIGRHRGVITTVGSNKDQNG